MSLALPILDMIGGIFGDAAQNRADRDMSQQSREGWELGKTQAEGGYNTVASHPEYKPSVDFGSMGTFSGSNWFKEDPLQPGKNTAGVKPLDQSQAFDKISPYDPRPSYEQARPISLDGFFSGVQAYNPTEIVKQAGAPPSLKAMLDAGRVSDSEFSKIVADPKLVGLQQQALGMLQEIAENNGMTIADRVRLRESMDAVARQQRMQRYAIVQHYESIGMAGAGVEMAAAMASGQESVETLSQAGAAAAAAGSERAQNAVLQLGSLASALRDQEFREKAAKAQAMDEINKFNASQSLDAIKAEWTMRAQKVEMMAAAGQSYFGNIMALQQAKAQAAQSSWENRFRYAESVANAGQQWFANVMNVTQARVAVRQDAYENYFGWAKAMDDYAQQGWQNRFQTETARYGAALDSYNSYVNKLKLQEESARNVWQSNFDLARTKSDAQARLGEYYRQMPAIVPSSPMNRAADWLGSGPLGKIGLALPFFGAQANVLSKAGSWVGNAAGKVGDFIGGLF